MGDIVTDLPPYDEWAGVEPQMRFRLYYDSELRSGQKSDMDGTDPIALAKHKQGIRKNFHKQLKQFWATNKFLSEHEIYPTDRSTGRSAPLDAAKFDEIGPSHTEMSQGKTLRLQDAVANQYVENGYRFVPLVRGDIGVLCALHVLLLKRDHPGSGVIGAGDLDNRLKVLVDGLTKPTGPGQLGGILPDADEDPFFCLLENDNLVTSLTVETDALLAAPKGRENQNNWVRSIVTVELRPYHVTPFNLGFA